MKILFAADVHPDPNSGAAGTEWQTIRAIRAAGHEVDEIWASDLGRRIQHGNLHYLLELPFAYRRLIAQRCSITQYDVIHVNQGHCFRAAIAHKRARRPGVFVCRSHGLDDRADKLLDEWRRRMKVPGRQGLAALMGSTMDRLLHRQHRLAYQNVDGIIVSSSGDQEYLIRRQGVPADRVARIAQAPSPYFMTSDAPAQSPARLRRILHVGGFAFWKGVHAVAQVANALLTEDSPWEFTWVCRESEHHQVRTLLTPMANARTQLVAWMDQQALMNSYDAHGIFLCPSLFEGFGKVFLEAMARGMCVIGTPTGGMPDIISHEDNGLIVGFNDPVAIMAAIEKLQCHLPLAESMSRKAAATAREYSWARVARETLDFYRHLGARG